MRAAKKILRNEMLARIKCELENLEIFCKKEKL